MIILRNALLFLISIFLLTGCRAFSGQSGGPSGEASKLPRGYSANETQNISISKNKLDQALKVKPELNRIRMVDVFRQGSAFPEYHLFDIRDNSVYALLGLQNRDVLIAANDYLVFDKSGFPRFVGLLPTTDKASITVRRGERDIKFEYNITEP